MDFEDKINTAIKEFPTIEKLLDIESLIKKIKSKKEGEKGSISPIVHYLYYSLYNKKKIQKLKKILINEPNNYKIKFILNWLLEEYNVMKNLDRHLYNIQNEQNLTTSIELLKDPFYEGYSEIEIASLLKYKYKNIRLQTKMPNSKPADVSCFINNAEYFIEIKTPSKGYKYIDALAKSAVDIKSGLKPKPFKLPNVIDRVYDVFNRAVSKFDGCLDTINSIIIIDITNSDIKGDHIDNTLFGESNFINFKKTDNNLLNVHFHRDNWNYFKSDNRLNKINLLVWYKRDYDFTGKVQYKYQIYEINRTNINYESFISIFQ